MTTWQNPTTWWPGGQPSWLPPVTPNTGPGVLDRVEALHRLGSSR